MAGQGVLWQLVSGFDPLGSYNRGQQQFTQQQNILQQLAGQEQDRQFRRETDARDFQFKKEDTAVQRALQERQMQLQAANAAASNARSDRAYQLQLRQFERGEIPAGFERDPQNPNALRPRAGGPEDPATLRARIQATKEPVAPQYREIDGPNGKQLIRINPDQTIVAPQIPGVTDQAPRNPFAPNGKMTQDQATAAIYADRIAASNNILNDLESVNQGPLGFIGGATSTQEPGAVENLFTGANRQKFQQAERDLINAILRKESGAVISPAEFANARRQYIPQPGDSEEVLLQKRQNREIALHGFFRAAGPSYTVPQQNQQKPQNNQQDPLGIR